MTDRMPPLAPEALSAQQQAAAAELAAGPRGGVRGPFIPLLRSPQLMDRLQKVGEYLRYHSALEPRLSEFATLIVSRHMTQQFEWQVHYPLALKAGLKREIADALAEGAHPRGMSDDEQVTYEFCIELLRTHGVSDPTYRRALARLAEHGVIDLVGLVGYFITVSLVMNVAHTPAAAGSAVPALESFPR
jgi:4-carboxymuconolactone decarboxylase